MLKSHIRLLSLIIKQLSHSSLYNHDCLVFMFVRKPSDFIAHEPGLKSTVADPKKNLSEFYFPSSYCEGERRAKLTGLLDEAIAIAAEQNVGPNLVPSVLLAA